MPEPIHVTSLVHAAFETPDVGRMTAYYEEVVGLTIAHRDGDGAVHLGTAGSPPAIVLRAGDAARLARVAVEVAPGWSTDRVVAALGGHGVEARHGSDPAPGVRAFVDLEDADGQALRLLVAAETAPAPGGAAGGPHGGIAPSKLGHVARRVADAQSVVAFYERVLGFRVSDWIGDFFAFLRCNADHHSLNFISSPTPGRIDHLAFQLQDLSHIGRACDHLARHRIPLIWGPGRHGAGHNLFAYYRDPDDHIVELFADLDLMLDESLGCFDPRPWHEDAPQRPKVWDPSAGANQWGIDLPDEMLR